MLLTAAAESTHDITGTLLLAGAGAGIAFSLTLATLSVAVKPQRRSAAVGVWSAGRSGGVSL